MRKWLLNTIGCCIIAALGFASWGGWCLYPHVTGFLDAWRNSSPGPTKPVVDNVTALLELIHRPCASVDVNGHLLPDGPICELNQAIHDIRKITTASGKQVQQTGKLIDATTQTMGEAGAAVKDTAGHFNKTADAATGTLTSATGAIEEGKRSLATFQPLLASLTRNSDDINAAIRENSPALHLVLTNTASMTESGAGILADGKVVADKSTADYMKARTPWGRITTRLWGGYDLLSWAAEHRP